MTSLNSLSVMNEIYIMMKKFKIIEASFNTQIIKGAIDNMTNLKSLLVKEQKFVNENELTSINVEIEQLIQKIIKDNDKKEIKDAADFLRDLADTLESKVQSENDEKFHSLVSERVKLLIAKRRENDPEN
jgi:hypothetical protein